MILNLIYGIIQLVEPWSIAQSGPERALIQKLYQGFFLSRRII
nr:MAG TPA: hypothetical protein [Caudoviricetes sp.]